MTMEEIKDLISITEAAKVAKRSRPTIYRWLKTGRITSITAGSRTLVFRDQVIEVAAKLDEMLAYTKKKGG
mgnify:CR=1 FL=1